MPQKSMGIFEKENEELLSYDGDAFLYFALTVLTVVLLPWTWVLVKQALRPRPPPEKDFEAGPAPDGTRIRHCTTSVMQAKRRAAEQQARSWIRRMCSSFGVQLVAAAILWGLLILVLWKLKDAPAQLRSFDPHAILGVSAAADVKDIKKAYRTKSLQHHPDKNPDNPMATVMFQQVAKAYAALTDENARRNYEKYGNPDGPVQMKVGIALHPALLVSKESQLWTLCIFFTILFAVPMSIVCCCLRGSHVAAGGVSAETLRVFHACIDSEVTAHDGPGLLAASAEAWRLQFMPINQLIQALVEAHPEPLVAGSLVQVAGGEFAGRRGVVTQIDRSRCKVEVWKVSDRPPSGPEDVEHKEIPLEVLRAAEPRIPCPFGDPQIKRISAIVWAHMWRLHRHLPPPTQMELESFLLKSDRLGRALVSVAWGGQGDRSGFLHVMKELLHFRQCLVQALDLGSSPLLQLPHVTQVPAGAPPLLEVIKSGGENLKLQLKPEQKLDIQEFCRHAPLVELTCEVQVSDEDNISVGDFATLTVTLTRQNLQEGEAAGPVHAPYWPGPKHEEWWLLVYDDICRRLITAELVLGTGRTETAKIYFMVPRAGRFKWRVHAVCDSYLGLDVECPVHFVALKKHEVKREIFVHPEDANIRSLFEELMMGLQQEEPESESEDEAPPVKAAPATAPKKSGDSDLDSGEEEPGPDLEGVWYKVTDQHGVFLYREPEEEPEQRVGSLPGGTVLRGYEGGKRPEGWLEIPLGQSLWARTTSPSKAGDGQPASAPTSLGGLAQQTLATLVESGTPPIFIRRWLRNYCSGVTAADMYLVREIEDLRTRLVTEDLIRRQVGEERFEQLIVDAEELRKHKRERLKKAIGLFATPNGIAWHVLPNGTVRGQHDDGNKIKDRLQVSPEGIHLGPFRLDETRSCACIHWVQKADPEKVWNWSPDRSLRTKMRLAGFQ